MGWKEVAALVGVEGKDELPRYQMGNSSPNVDHSPDAGIPILDRKGKTPS
jgi:hypothetical protein